MNSPIRSGSYSLRWYRGRRRVGRRGLIIGLVGFFFVNLQLFYVALRLGSRFVGIAFFVWVGIFSLTCIAQFWSFASDIYSKDAGDRLFGTK